MFTKMKSFLTSPSKAFANEKDTSLGEAFKYFAVITVIYSVLAGVVSFFYSSMLLGPILGTGLGLLLIPATIIMLLILTPILGAVLHVFAYIFGARKGVENTLKAIFYGSTPNMLLGWIPIIGFIFAIWSFILNITGLKSLQDMSTSRAIAALVLPAIITGVIVAAFAFWILSSMFVSGIA